jgi:hypothetical protein
MGLGISEVENEETKASRDERDPTPQWQRFRESTGVAAWVGARCDVVEGYKAHFVQQGVEEAERGFSL